MHRDPDGFDSYARAYVRRADALEAERVERREELHARARSMASMLYEAYGDDVRVFLFGSLVEARRLRTLSGRLQSD